MRKQALFHTHQEHQRKLQSLDRMHGHQLHAIFPGIALGLTRFERGVREKGVQHGQVLIDLGIVFITLAGADQFLQVLGT